MFMKIRAKHLLKNIRLKFYLRNEYFLSNNLFTNVVQSQSCVGTVVQNICQVNSTTHLYFFQARNQCACLKMFSLSYEFILYGTETQTFIIELANPCIEKRFFQRERYIVCIPMLKVKSWTSLMCISIIIMVIMQIFTSKYVDWVKKPVNATKLFFN